MHLMHSTCTIVCVTHAYHAFRTIFWQILHRSRVIKYRWYRVIIVSNPKISCNIVWIQKKISLRGGHISYVRYPLSYILCQISSSMLCQICSPLASRYNGRVGCLPHPSVQLQVEVIIKAPKYFHLSIFLQWHLLPVGQPEPWSKSSKNCIWLHCPLWLWWGRLCTFTMIKFEYQDIRIWRKKMWFSGPGQCDKQQGGDGRGQDDARLLQQEDVHQQVRGVEHAHHEGQSL